MLAAFGFLCGAMPFAVWLGRVALNRDIRGIGDGNPGAFNVLRAGGPAWGGLAVALEVAKGALPVGLAAQVLRVDGPGLVACAIAPVLGHAYSPFLGFRGGKAVAVSFGIWIGLTIWPVPLVSALLLVSAFALLTVSGWAVMFAACGVGIYLVLTGAPGEWWLVWALNLIVLVLKHRADLSRPLQLRRAFR